MTRRSKGHGVLLTALCRTGRRFSASLVRYATLAPSSHNTQCWKCALQERRISIVPDFSRRCPAVDPDHHHLFVSLGCAAENLIHAARAHALMGEATFEVAPTEAVHIALEPTKPSRLVSLRRFPSGNAHDASSMASPCQTKT